LTFEHRNAGPNHILDADARIFQNQKEIEAIVLLAKHLQDENVSYRIITPYDAQRGALEQALKEEDLNWKDKCFNVDSFQGLYCNIPAHMHNARASKSRLYTDTRN